MDQGHFQSVPYHTEICFAIPFILHGLTTSGLVAAQLLVDAENRMSWMAILIYSHGGIWSVAVGLLLSSYILGYVAMLVEKVLEFLELRPLNMR